MTNERTRLGMRAEAGLYASACLLLGLIVVQAARGGLGGWTGGWTLGARFGPAEARADSASQVADYTMLTMDGGNEDVVVVLDGHTEELFVYHVKNRERLELLQKYSVSNLFTDARAGGGGKR